MAVTFVDCPADRAEPLREFFAEMYSPGYVLSRDAAFLQWQFGAAPRESRQGLDVKLSLVDGKIAGCVGYIPIELNIGTRVVRAAWAANWMVDDQYRRLGLGPLLMRELSGQFDVTLALGGNRDAHALLPRMGWTDFGDLRRYVAVLDRDAAATLSEGDPSSWPALGDATADSNARQVERFDEAATTLWDRVWGHAAGTRRTADYLNWRYADHPLFDYRLFENRVNGALQGFAVYRVEAVRDMPVRVGRIVELVAEAGANQALLDAVVADARRAGVAMVDFFCSAPAMAAVMTAAGFSTSVAEQFPMLFQPLDRSRTGVLFMAHLQKCPDAKAIQDWYVTTADGDQDRPN
jgi:hypothetical protein